MLWFDMSVTIHLVFNPPPMTWSCGVGGLYLTTSLLPRSTRPTFFIYSISTIISRRGWSKILPYHRLRRAELDLLTVLFFGSIGIGVIRTLRVYIKSVYMVCSILSMEAWYAENKEDAFKPLALSKWASTTTSQGKDYILNLWIIYHDCHCLGISMLFCLILRSNESHLKHVRKMRQVIEHLVNHVYEVELTGRRKNKKERKKVQVRRSRYKVRINSNGLERMRINRRYPFFLFFKIKTYKIKTPDSQKK